VPSGTEITIAHVIQQAVAPVFLLTGISAMLGVLTNRLSRIVDRLRTLETQHLVGRDTVVANGDEGRHAKALRREETTALAQRRVWVHWAIILCTLGALLVCVVIATLFLGVEFGRDTSRAVVLLFVGAMLSLIAGLICFLREIALATRTFDIELRG